MVVNSGTGGEVRGELTGSTPRLGYLFRGWACDGLGGLVTGSGSWIG